MDGLSHQKCWGVVTIWSPVSIVMCDDLFPGLGESSTDEVAPADGRLLGVGSVDEAMECCIGVCVIGW
jgi:hypothetical protein